MRRTSPAALALPALLAGCAGGQPLLHPAKTLPQGEVSALAGVSAQLATSSLARPLRDAREQAAQDPAVPGAPGTNPTYAEGALVAAAIAPGIAPVVGARVGIGERFEAGLAYTGRGARVDARRAFPLGGSVMLSAGVGGSAAFYGHRNENDLPNVDLGSLHGYGADVPLLIGWESVGGLYQVWAGARGGWEHVSVDNLSSEPRNLPPGAGPISLSATRFYGGGLVGAAVGFRHIHVALEVDIYWQSVSGAYNQTQVNVQGLSITPGSALWWRF